MSKFSLIKFLFVNKFARKCGVIFERFILVLLFLTLLFRFVPIPYSAYMLEQKVGHWFTGESYKINYQWVSINDISKYMQLAVIAAEDQRFSQHWGIDLEGIKAALRYNKKNTKLRGGSTLSQQTAKNLYLWHGQSWIRKGLEVPITAMLEMTWSKKRILEVYLNIAEFGNGIFGVEAASRYYFKKSAQKLTAREAALLAAVLPNPIHFKVNKPSEIVRKKQNWVLKQMHLLGLNYLNKL